MPKIAKAMKPHTIAKELALSATIDIVRVMIGEEFVNKLNGVCISNDRYSRSDYPGNEIFFSSILCIQLDESTEFILCKPLETTTTSCGIFEKVDAFQKYLKSSVKIVVVWPQMVFQKLNDNYCEKHFNLLAEEISYSPNLPDSPFALARSRFTVKVEYVIETSREEFIDLINSDVSKTDFSSKSISQLWIKCLQSYSVMSETYLRHLFPFPKTYLCPTRSSRLLFIMSKFRSRLNAEVELRCVLSKTILRIPDLVKQKQAQACTDVYLVAHIVKNIFINAVYIIVDSLQII
ncbi:hypothetical protein RF11_09808 [Thelohanellus kitauei]|uniref:Uncharacterized protein n=1 Tax=Thelohanellus kitauei TaxID=669202 RepID=A0A0C2NA33_THEKT|nr:hypothetical protein RF11_09808 [Thelohanellus kitauei]